MFDLFIYADFYNTLWSETTRGESPESDIDKFKSRIATLSWLCFVQIAQSGHTVCIATMYLWATFISLYTTLL